MDIRNYFTKISEAPRLSRIVSDTETPGPASASREGSVHIQTPAEPPAQEQPGTSDGEYFCYVFLIKGVLF